MNKNNSKIIITSPRSLQGGVTSFVSNLKPFLGEAVFFHRGLSSTSKKNNSRLLNSVFMPFQFICLLKRDNTKRVIVNSSLSFWSILRDGILVRLAKWFKRDTILFVHGFRQGDLKYRRLLKWGYLRADKIIVLSSEFKKLLKDAGFSKQIEVSFNPIDYNLLEKLSHKPQKKDMRNILFLSRVEKYKGIFESLDWFKLLKKSYPELTFHILGDGSARHKAEEYVNRHNIEGVIFHGFTVGDDKIEMLAKCSFFILMSYGEGLPISILEAMAAGQVVLTRPVGGIKDLYEQCEFGAMLDSLSPEVFAEAFEKYYNNPELFEHVSSNNQQFAKTNFHPSMVAEKIKKMFDSI